jgi:thiol-disulfide isomerase/thioredoxin
MRVVIAAAFMLSVCATAQADLFKCVGKDGRVSYQAEPCAASVQEKRLKAPLTEVDEAGPGGVSLIDVTQAARRISGRQGRPTVVLLYSTTCPLSRRMFPEFVAIANQYRARGIDFLVFSTDEEENFAKVPVFLTERKAPFAPIAIKPWEAGDLIRAMAPLGIEVGSTWVRPLVAVRDSSGRVVRKTEAMVELGGLRKTLDTLAR